MEPEGPARHLDGTRPLRVLHLTREYPPVVWGGLGTAVGGLTMASAQAGIDTGVVLVGASGFSSYGQRVAEGLSAPALGRAGVQPSGVTIFEASDDHGVEEALALARRWQPDVVHVHPVELLPVAQTIRSQLGIPLVYTAHSLNFAEYAIGEEPPEILNLWRAQEELLTVADRVIVISQSERDLLRSYRPNAAPRCRVVGNGIHDIAVRPRAEQAWDTSRPCTILFVGRFVARKGIHELFSAMPAVLESSNSARFILAGGYGSAEEVERQWLPANLYPYRDRIRFTGWLSSDQVEPWYRQADVLVIPSWYEPFGMVVLEGMLHGLPIAACDIGGPGEILEHEETALLVRPKDAPDLAHALVRLVTDAALRSRLGASAWHEVRRTWLWPSVVERVRGVYSEAVAVAA